jgi:DNA repair photolyase
MKEFKSPYKQLNRKINTWCKYTKRLDTYGRGCQHDCKYCYAKSLLNFRNLWNPDEPAKASLYKIKCAIRRLSTNDVVRMGGMTDCFQPLEITERVTYKTIQMLNQFKIGYLIVTKSDTVANPEYLDIYDKSLAHFQVTLTSTSKNKYEKVPHPETRIHAIEKLQSFGFDVSVRLSPFIPENINFEVINSIKCDKLLIEFLKVNHWIEKTFDIDYHEYTLKFGGFRHLPLNRKIELVNLITGFNQVSIGEYVYDHYLYFKENVNYNKYDCCNLSLKSRPQYLQLNLF